MYYDVVCIMYLSYNVLQFFCLSIYIVLDCMFQGGCPGRRRLNWDLLSICVLYGKRGESRSMDRAAHAAHASAKLPSIKNLFGRVKLMRIRIKQSVSTGLSYKQGFWPSDNLKSATKFYDKVTNLWPFQSSHLWCASISLSKKYTITAIMS